MTSLLRNFFYSVGFALIAFFYTANPDDLELRHLAILVHSSSMQQLVLLLTLALTGLEALFGLSTKAMPPIGVGAQGGRTKGLEQVEQQKC